MPDKVNDLVKDFKATLSKMLANGGTHEEQRIIARAMITVFQNKSNQTNVSMVKYAAEVIMEEYPHLKEDVEKLLILL